MEKDEQFKTLAGHLGELRTRVIYASAAVLLVTLITFFFSSTIIKFLLLPSGGLQLNAFSLMDGFMIRWRVALYAGIVISFPVWAYQSYRFIKPGLLDSERQTILPVLSGSIILFVLGSAFGYYLLWEMIRVMKSMFPPEIHFLPAADDYISFVIFFLLACGLAFQLPTLVIVLVRLHVLNTDVLRKQRRLAYFALFVFAEIITPVSDPIVAPLIVMVPLVILYESSICISRRIEAHASPAVTNTV